jgi:DNA-binding GntR family transcriptional regulator
VVTELSATEVDEIYTMRIALETKALERAIPNLRSADFIRARGVLEIIESEPDRAQWSELNWEYHATLYQAAGMPRLLNTIEMLHNNVARYLIIYLDRLSAQDISQEQHLAIFDACCAGDVGSANQHLATHLDQACERLVAFLSK